MRAKNTGQNMNTAVSSFQKFACANPSTTNDIPTINIAIPETTKVAEATFPRTKDIYNSKQQYNGVQASIPL